MKQEPPKPRDAGDSKLISDVEAYGCHVVGVLADGQGPGFAYSVGLFRNYAHPETLLFGLDQMLMRQLIVGICDELKRGKRFEPGGRYPDLRARHDCEFRRVGLEHYPPFLGYARWFYRGDTFPVLQCFWPDMSGIFPWEKGFEPKFLPLQPVYGQL
jgi:hypothetical protein